MNKCFFSAIKFFESIDSTNSELLNNEYEDKTLIYTYDQTKGRGRFDRKWITFKNKALALSFLLKNNGTEKNRFNLLKNYFIFNMIFSITLVEILDKNYKIKSWIKWPNDIYIEDKKLAGILTESKFLDKNNFKIVAGIGININVEEDQLKDLDKKVCSIYSETG
ncbi:MAG: biotin--[acetyl-CoA-carboxylase] ligase, partial [Spirochaetota bacterium]